MNADIGSPPKKVEHFRICHDEDEKSNMEAPCFCHGSLKYAHRKCVQRWCDEKGDIVCEICQQLFKPGYAAPSPLFHYAGFLMSFRGNWELSTDRNLLYPNFDDYSECTWRILIFCRVVAMIFVILLLVRHTLPYIIIHGDGEYSISLVMIMVLRTIGVLLPFYILVEPLMDLLRRRNRQDFPISPLATSNEENQLPETHVIQIG